MPSRENQINQLNFKCDPCGFVARDKSHLTQHIQGSTHIKRMTLQLVPDIENMTTEQQKEFIHQTQRYKTEVELINESPKYSHDLPFLENPARAGIDNVGRLQALSQKYKQDIYRAYIRTLNYYKNEYKKQQLMEIKKNQGEELLAQQQEILAEQRKMKENKINAKVFKRQLQIEKTEFILQQQRQLQQLEMGIIPDMSNYIQNLTQSNSTSIEQQQSEEYTISEIQTRSFLFLKYLHFFLSVISYFLFILVM